MYLNEFKVFRPDEKGFGNVVAVPSKRAEYLKLRFIIKIEKL